MVVAWTGGGVMSSNQPEQISEREHAYTDFPNSKSSHPRAIVLVVTLHMRLCELFEDVMEEKEASK
jgi:hypothetical protein